MDTIYDWVTVILFIVLVIGFFRRGDNSNMMIAKAVLAGIGFAVANQVGNAGIHLGAWAIIAASALYSYYFVLRPSS